MALHYKHWCMKFCVKHTNIHYESLCACKADIVLVYSITVKEGLSVSLVKLFHTTTGRKPHMQDKWEVSPVIKVGIYGCLQLPKHHMGRSYLPVLIILVFTQWGNHINCYLPVVRFGHMHLQYITYTVCRCWRFIATYIQMYICSHADFSVLTITMGLTPPIILLISDQIYHTFEHYHQIILYNDYFQT